MEYAFAVTDLNLYLDLHPEDKEAYALFQQYIDEGKRAAREFTSVYGPIVMTDAGYKNYEWDNNPWPWDDEGGNLYV